MSISKLEVSVHFRLISRVTPRDTHESERLDYPQRLAEDIPMHNIIMRRSKEAVQALFS